MQGGSPVSIGLCVLDRHYAGLYEVTTEKNCRGKGYGEQLILHMLNWARDNGALYSYLQVLQDNTAAIRLYDKLGYKDCYSYWYRCKF